MRRLSDIVWTPPSHPGDNRRSSTERQRCHLARWGRRWTTGRGDTDPLRCGDDGLSPIHSPYYHYYLHPSPRCGKGRTVKFRCEREVLADALATAGRAATSRTGTLPVLSGLRLEVRRRRAVGHRHRSRAVDPPDRRRRRRARRRGRRPGAPRGRHRARAAVGRGRGRARATTEVSISAGRSQFAIRPLGLDDYPMQARAGRRGGHAVVVVGRRGAAPGRAGGEHRRCPGRAHRRADRRRGRRRADGGHRLVPPGRPRPARRPSMLAERAEGARAEPGAQRAAAGARPTRRAARSASGRATRCSSRAARG